MKNCISCYSNFEALSTLAVLLLAISHVVRPINYVRRIVWPPYALVSRAHVHPLLFPRGGTHLETLLASFLCHCCQPFPRVWDLIYLFRVVYFSSDFPGSSVTFQHPHCKPLKVYLLSNPRSNPLLPTLPLASRLPPYHEVSPTTPKPLQDILEDHETVPKLSAKISTRDILDMSH